MSEQEKETLQEEEIIIEEVIEEEIDDEDDDDNFLKSLEKIDEEERLAQEKKEEEELRIKNKNAEEARKRREAEARAKKEAEEKTEEEETKAEEEVKEEDYKEDGEESEEVVEHPSPEEQVKELVEKHPDLDLGELDKNPDFQEYLQGKWFKGGKTIAQIYDDFIDFKSRLSKVAKEEVEKEYKKKTTPAIKSSSGATGGNTKAEDIYSQEEIARLGERLPYMSPQEYARIEAKLERSVNYYKKNK